MSECKEVLKTEVTLGAILELLHGNKEVQATNIPWAVELICMLMEIDPLDMREIYHDWQAGKLHYR